MKKILVATDLSGRGDRAVQRAISLAAEHHASLEVIHVIDESLPSAIAPRYEADVRATIEKMLASLTQASVIVPAITIVRGLDFREIIASADKSNIDLVLLGIHRHESPLLFRGTTAERVIRFGHRPVLVVKDVTAGPYRRAIVAADASAHSDAAIEMAARLVPGGEVHIVHVLHKPFNTFLGGHTQDQLMRGQVEIVSSHLTSMLAALIPTLGVSAPRFNVIQKEGEIHRVIREMVTVLNPDLLGIGTHARTGIALAIIGSIAADLLASAPVDVLATKALRHLRRTKDEACD
jgi:nucleotide-binding universal stress UspA family protein